MGVRDVGSWLCTDGVRRLLPCFNASPPTHIDRPNLLENRAFDPFRTITKHKLLTSAVVPRLQTLCACVYPGRDGQGNEKSAAVRCEGIGGVCRKLVHRGAAASSPGAPCVCFRQPNVTPPTATTDRNKSRDHENPPFPGMVRVGYGYSSFPD